MRTRRSGFSGKRIPLIRPTLDWPVLRTAAAGDLPSSRNTSHILGIVAESVLVARG
jgi:hypothetical protein